MGREYELKFRASARQMTAIMEEYGGFREIAMETTYYDTPDSRLAPLYWTLRRRMENGVSICTLKTPCEEGGRNEWEVECDDITAAIPELCKLGAPEELKELVCGGVEAVCSARFIRQAATIQLENAVVELSLDRGFLRGGARIVLLGEVEVELKEGSKEAVRDFAAKLAEKYWLIQELKSKYRRALELTGRI